MRHARPEIKLEMDSRRWELNEEGREQAKETIRNVDLASIEYILTSTETKARQTAEPLAEYYDIPIIDIEKLGEAHLDKFYPINEFLELKKVKFEDRVLEIGESHKEAQDRIIETIEGLRSYLSEHNFLIISHGTVISLYMEYLNNWSVSETIKYWESIQFCQIEEI